ncbi:hypothetical protein DFJ74DRAFT_697277 [Hyaloraphidium curvatum]|nr:hypothetical protein DFJ74DRAFT_697277 [Hyaloraphidium curvatum]
MDGESANGTAPPNSTALSPYVPNPLDVFNETAASTRRGTVLGSPQLGSGSLSLTLFGNQTITDEVDFVSAHLLLRTGDRSASGDPKREAAFVGYGVHVLEEGAVRFLLVPPGRDLPLEELLRLMPTQGTFTRARNATRRFLEGKVAQLRRRIEAEGPDAYEIFDSGSRPFAFGAPIVPPDCSFQLHLQLSPLGHPHTEEELLEYTAQMHGGTYDGRALPHLPAPSASMFLYSRDCLLALEAPMTNGMLLPVFFSRLNALVVAVSVATAAEMVGIVRQFGHTQTLGRLAKVSLWMLGVGAAWDAMLSAVALMGAMVLEPLLMPLLALAFLKLSSCAIFQGRYILLVLRARHIDVTPAGFQRVYVLWVLAMAVAWAVVSLGGWVFWTLIVASLGSMMPGQIVMNARRNNRKTLDHAYIVSTIVSKFFLPIYYLGCPGNVVVPDAGDTLPFALALGLLAGLQVAALLSQDAWGGRWFLPRGLFPPSYDYHRPPPPDLEAGEASCAICYTPLDVGPAGKEGRMITPCGHLFCTGCLTTWMEERMLCPVCRQALPGVVE